MGDRGDQPSIGSNYPPSLLLAPSGSRYLLAASPTMQSLFTNKGGRPGKLATPSEREGLALAVAAAMQWSKLRDSSNKMFFTNVAATVKRLEGTERDWTKVEIVQFVQNTLFGGIPQYAVEAWIQKEFLPKRGEQITEHRRVIIENFMYRYLASVDSGVDFE